MGLDPAVPSEWRAIFVSLFAASALHSVLGSGLFLMRRHTHPIRGDSMGLVLNCTVSLKSCMLLLCYVFGHTMCHKNLLWILERLDFEHRSRRQKTGHLREGRKVHCEFKELHDVYYLFVLSPDTFTGVD